MEEKNEIKRPFIIEMEEAKQEFIQVINKAINVHKLPFYVIDTIWAGLASQIKEGAKEELEIAKKQIEQNAVPKMAEQQNAE